jgi:hypothetical protein
MEEYLEQSGQWMMLRDLTRQREWNIHSPALKNLVWLPHGYRGVTSVAPDKTLVIGQQSGAVSFFTLR